MLHGPEKPMTKETTWIAALATVAILALYEATLLLATRRHPERLARIAHRTLREDWFAAVSAMPGSEVLVVQTLRNAVMSASMTASTAVLGLMGTVTLTAPSLQAGLATTGGLPHFTPRLAVELVLLALLFASLICSVMAVRYYNHVGFIGGTPVGSEPRRRWTPQGVAYVRRAGLLYSWSIRHLMLVVPIVAFLLHPWAGPLGAGLVIAVLFSFDRFDPGLSGAPEAQ